MAHPSTSRESTPKQVGEGFIAWDYNALPPAQTSPRSPLRHLLDDYLDWSRDKDRITLFTSVDVSVFTNYCDECRAARRRPPSLVAYVARCLGVVCRDARGVTASRLNGRVYTPQHVNLAVLVSAKTPDGDSIPYILELLRADERTLPDLGEELASRSRALRREGLGNRVLAGAMKLGRFPQPLRRSIYRLALLHPKFRHAIAHTTSFIGLTALTGYTGNRSYWGAPVMPYSCSIVMGGLSRKALVVEGDRIEARPCLDLSLSCDHALFDAAEGAQMCERLCAEIESGRLLNELETVG